MSAAAPGKIILPRRSVMASALGAASFIVLTATGCGGIAAGAGTAGKPAGDDVKTVRYQGSPNNVSLPELGRNESSEALKYWKSVGVASPGGRIQDKDFTLWSDYLTSAGIIDGALDLPKLYTNEFNGLATGTGAASGTPTSNTKGQP